MRNKLIGIIGALLITYSPNAEGVFPPGVWPPFDGQLEGLYTTVEEKKEREERRLDDLDLDYCQLRYLGIKELACSEHSPFAKGVYFYLDCSSSQERSLESHCSGIFCSDNHEIYFTPTNSDFYLYIEMNRQQRDEYDEQEEVIEIITEKLL